MPARKGPFLLCLLIAWTFHPGKGRPAPRPRGVNQPVAMKVSKQLPATPLEGETVRKGIRF